MKRCALLTALILAGLAGGAPAADRVTSINWVDPAWSPNGKLIAIGASQDSGDLIYVVRPDGSGVRALDSKSRSASWPTWSPDSRKIAFYSDGGIDVVRADGTGREVILGVGFNPAWSPRGRRIAFGVGQDELGPAYIYAATPDGMDEEAVYDKEDGYHSYFAPTWSPNGERLAFSAGVRGDDGFDPERHWIGIIDQYRGKPKIYARGLNPSALDWGPRGRTIAFSNYDGEMFVINLRTRRVRRLGRGMHPSWSPDGRRIAFTYRWSVYVMDANGTHRRLILPATAR